MKDFNYGAQVGKEQHIQKKLVLQQFFLWQW